MLGEAFEDLIILGVAAQSVLTIFVLTINLSYEGEREEAIEKYCFSSFILLVVLVCKKYGFVN